MKKILVPTDFSDQAQHAFEVALALARKTGAAIKMLHLVEIPHATTDFSATGDIISTNPMNHVYTLNLLEIARKRMAGLKDIAQQENIQVVEEVDTDDIHARIIRTIKEDQVDLVVMGSKGSSGLEEFFIGSNTEKVVREATCPVLTIKRKHPSFEVKNLVLASDFKKGIDTAFHQFKIFQELFQAQLHLVYINTPGDFEAVDNMKREMDVVARRIGFQNYTLNVYNDAVEEDGILNFARDIKADLIMMATHGRTGFARLLSGSIAEDLVNHTNLPVLTLHLS